MTTTTTAIPRLLLPAFAAVLLATSCGAFAPNGHVSYQIGSETSTTSLSLGDFFNFNKNDGAAEQQVAAEPADANASGQPEGEEDQDPVEKMFGFFFGAKEEKPMGMDRFGPERFPEQYPAIKDEWAEPLEGDDGEMAKIRPFLKNTNLERRGLKLTYDANRDGWDPISFHTAVDKKGGAVVLCTTRMGVVCGGYNPKGWVG